MGSLLRPRVILHSWGSGLLCVWQLPARTGTLIDLGLPLAPPRGNITIITISREERTTVPFHSEDTGTQDTQVTSKAHRRTQALTYMKSSGSFAPTSIGAWKDEELHMTQLPLGLYPGPRQGSQQPLLCDGCSQLTGSWHSPADSVPGHTPKVSTTHTA